MNLKLSPSVLLILLLLPILTVRAMAQDVGRVSPANLPLPLPTAAPLAPDALRAHNPWTLAMTGTWRFDRTWGHVIAGGEFVPEQENVGGISASTHETANPPQNAFDADATTRWCADSAGYPQWLQSDLGGMRQIVGVTLSWERSNEHYRYRLEGSVDGKQWKTLSDAAAVKGIGDGPVKMAEATARYLRVTVLGTDGTGWASIRECQVNILEGGKQVQWRPPAPKPVPTTQRDAFAAPDFNDTAWHNLAVPSNWEMAGYSPPTYNAVDNTVGLYRRWVTVPESWSGRRIYWHFDGALDGAEVFINGQKAGYHESGYTAWDIDLTDLVRVGQRNLFAVRVSKTTPSVDCETGDFQCMGGIYRDTFLVSVPRTHIHDLVVRTPLDANYHDATLNTRIEVQGAPGETVEVIGKLFSADGHPTTVQISAEGRIEANGMTTLALSAPVTAPKLWSAEKPNLYYVVFTLTSDGKTAERVEQRFGFRQIDIKDNVVLWNGQPIKCTGVCRHDFWADKGFALTDKEWNRDLTLIKAANINAIRTSHYNHAARFLELCEEKGIYILDEVPYCWIGDQVKDPKYAPFLLQRAEETLARDKNRPCVLAWSLGNENPSGPDSQEVMDLVKRLDPTRPAFVSSVGPNDIKGQAWEDDHYPDPNYVNQIASSGRLANFSEHPHIFYQKETQVYDPGASDLWSETLIKTWDKLWKSPNILGSFIWEWQNQGIADKYPDKTRDLWYGPDHLRQENNKGIVDAYRVPKPEWWIVKMVYSPVVVENRTVTPANGTCTVSLLNHYAFTDLKELQCHWSIIMETIAGQTTTLSKGVMHIACPPGQSIQASFPAPSGQEKLRLEFIHPNGRSIVIAKLPVAGVPLPPPPSALPTGGDLTIEDKDGKFKVSNRIQEFLVDKRMGTINWKVGGHECIEQGPDLNLGEKKNSNEQGFYRPMRPRGPSLPQAQVTASQEKGGVVHVTVTSDVPGENTGAAVGKLVCTYEIHPDADIRVAWRLDWTAPDIHLWEVGLKFYIRDLYAQTTWQRDSYFTDYPLGHIGEPTGVAHVIANVNSLRRYDPAFRATKRALHWQTFTDNTGAGLAVIADDTPLVTQAEDVFSDTGFYTTLRLSREVAGPRDFSGSWVSEHDILAQQGKSLSGAFILRAIGP